MDFVWSFPPGWYTRIGTSTSADFCEHGAGFPVRPAFRASFTHGYASQISPDKNMDFRCTSSSSTNGVCRERFCCLLAAHLRVSLGGHRSVALVVDVSVRSLAALVIRRSEKQTPIRRFGFLPTVRCLPAVAYAKYLDLIGYIWYAVLQINSRFRTGD